MNLTTGNLDQELANLFDQAGDAHEKAHAQTSGVDPDWPIWYADYLLERLKDLLHANFTRSELVYLLVLVDKEQRLRAPGANWATFYARFFAERYT
jgi:hypothetical protein